jgi:hypothetical protein
MAAVTSKEEDKEKQVKESVRTKPDGDKNFMYSNSQWLLVC